MPPTPFTVVLGVHDITPVPTAARAYGFAHRFALVQSTRAPGEPGPVVSPGPLLTLLAALDHQRDQPGTLYWDERRHRCTTRGAVGAHYGIAPRGQHELLHAGEWRTQGRLSVLLATEDWSVAAGPAPYRDSVTYSFYSAEDLSAFLLAALQAAGHAPAAVIRADHTSRRPFPRWARHAYAIALGVLLLAAVFTLAGAPVGRGPHPQDLRARASLWFSVPVGLAFLYATGHLLWQRHHRQR